MEKVGIVWPNQKSFGTHINISGGGMLKTAPHKEAAVKFLEYLASDEAQRYFADGNNEWPAVAERQGHQSGARSPGQVQGRQRCRSADLAQEPGQGAEDLRPRRLQVGPVQRPHAPLRGVFSPATALSGRTPASDTP